MLHVTPFPAQLTLVTSAAHLSSSNTKPWTRLRCEVVRHETEKSIKYDHSTHNLTHQSLPFSTSENRINFFNPWTRSCCKLVRHLSTTGISILPYLGTPKPRKNPNLNEFYKNTTGSTL